MIDFFLGFMGGIALFVAFGLYVLKMSLREAVGAPPPKGITLSEAWTLFKERFRHVVATIRDLFRND